MNESCRYSTAHKIQGIPAVTTIFCGPIGKVPVCHKCADFYQRMAERTER